MTDFNAWSASALWIVLEVSAQATLCLAVILVLRRALGKHLRPDWSYALWGVLILRMILPVSYNAPLLSYTVPSEGPQNAAPATNVLESSAITVTNNTQDVLPTTDMIVESPAITITNGPANPDETYLSADELTVKPIEAAPTPLQTSEPRTVSVATILFAVWLTGAITVLSIVVYRHLRLTRAIERDAIPASESISHVLRQVRDELRVTLWPLVLLTPSIATPTVIGVMRPRILLPKALAESASRDELRLILMHELMHVRRRDLWIAWLWLAALSLHWFNPLMWWAGAHLRRDRELACDSRVLAALPDREHAVYGHTLIKTMTAMNREKKFARLTGAAAIVENEAELEGRLTMIKAYRPARAFHRLSGIAAAFALICAAFIQTWGVAQEQPRPAAPDATTPSSPSTSSTTFTVSIPNPFANINDEDQLSKLRDENAKSGDIVGACEAEMRRVKIRAASRNPWKDKIDFGDVYRNLPPAGPTNPEFKKRVDALNLYLVNHMGDADYPWRIFHLESMMSNNKAGARGLLEKALRTYPRVAYTDPTKHSKYQHLVNDTAMLIWDLEGVDAAEKFVLDTWKNDRRFAYFFDPPWDARYKQEKLPPDRLAKLQAAMGEKPPHIEIKILLTPTGPWYFEMPASWDEIDIYLSQLTTPFDFYISLGYTSDEMSIKSWHEAQTRLSKAVQDRGFAYFSDIGKQPTPKTVFQQVTVLIAPEGLLYEGQKVTWDEIEKKLSAIPNPQDHFLALGRTEAVPGESDDLFGGAHADISSPDGQKAQALVTKLGFHHVSLIGYQPAPASAPHNIAGAQPTTSAISDTAPSIDRSNPYDFVMNQEILDYYSQTAPEVQEFLRTTARSFGPSGLWLPKGWLMDVDREKKIPYLAKLLEEGTYGRHLCKGLAEASTLEDAGLVPGLIKVASYHRDDQDYDCRPKWMAIAALARQEDESAVPTLVPLVDHGNLNTRMWAQAALARITDQSFGTDKQAWANWWNAAGKTPALGPDAVKPWTPPAQPPSSIQK